MAVWTLVERMVFARVWIVVEAVVYKRTRIHCLVLFLFLDLQDCLNLLIWLCSNKRQMGFGSGIIDCFIFLTK
ncbi:hypothetical protein HanRHA438_Chr16g0749071 [Helianthus annuus]|nr:hypothetical protein HanIR_Chr16g0800921 [Helianthus annuus]KAJ0834912.1 hypothetical protein HanRHA438_Chr16g0749071 [Helianthus annuus]